MLSIKNLHVAVDSKPILQGINLTINAGEVHAIMGPNGSGKSTLAYVLAGRSGYQITQGDILYQGKSILEQAANERAQAGIFVVMQYPVEIPGVSNISFLNTIVNVQRKQQGLPELDAFDFLTQVKGLLKKLDMEEAFLYRAVNEGFSGGEKKRNEILQLLLLKPNLAILDEMDSGLDIDALRILSERINELRDQQRSFLVITHYQRLLDYITPDHIHVLQDGRIVKSGDASLALELEQKGYVDIV